MKVKEWEQSEAYRIMADLLVPNIWVSSSEMNIEEKEKFPSHETTGGYLKSIPMHEAWSNMWNNLIDRKKNVFLTLPNFDKEKFQQITGIKLK
jgi:hypothetical protein